MNTKNNKDPNVDSVGETLSTGSRAPANYGNLALIADLGLFLTTMIFIRTISVPEIGYMGNVLVNSLATLIVATLLLYRRGETWKSLGLSRPVSLLKMGGVAIFILEMVIVSILFYESVIKDYVFPTQSANASTSDTETRFEGIEGNGLYFLSIIFLVWIESFLEELLDRGFLLTKLEQLFSIIPLSVVLAVKTQAAIFGFRHSPTHGVSGAMVTGVIGLVFGIAYVAFGRNLWALIIAHCFLNSMSMVERFFETP